MAPPSQELEPPAIPGRFTIKTIAVILSGDGEGYDDGLKLGKHLWESGVATIIGDGEVCRDACALAFAGGSSKTLHLNGTLIFPNLDSYRHKNRGRAFLALYNYLIEKGVGEDILGWVLTKDCKIVFDGSAKGSDWLAEQSGIVIKREGFRDWLARLLP